MRSKKVQCDGLVVYIAPQSEEPLATNRYWAFR